MLLLESGGLANHHAADALSEIENVGAPRVMDQAIMRPRVLGGASSLWTGRCAPLDEIDFERRAWVPHSGWPLSPTELQPYLERSAAHLGLGVGSGFTEAGPAARRRAAKVRAGLDRGLLRPFFWQFSRDPSRRFDHARFGRFLLAHKARNTRILTHATVLRIDTDDMASRVCSVQVADRAGRRRTVAARAVVLCAGGIENARLLLASNEVAPAGLGNGHGLVGRFLMDHPRGGIGQFDHAQQAGLAAAMANLVLPTGRGAFRFCKGVRLSPAVQEREGLLNCAAWLGEVVTEDDPWSAAQRLLRRRGRLGRELKAIAANAGLLACGLRRAVAHGGSIPRKLSRLVLNCTVEQRPDPESRVTLSDRLDRNGVPLSRVDWRVSEQEQRTARRMAELVAQEFTRIGIPAPELAPWVQDGEPFPPDFQDVAHHIGTTRMGAHERAGVVDPWCRVHGIKGLYVAGSSVFPTGGHANPTQTIVALAIRLADTLRREVA